MKRLANNLCERFATVWIILAVTTQFANARPLFEQPASEKKPLPPARWMRSRKIDVKHIALNLQFDWQKNQAYGTAAISLAPFNAASEISLDAGNLTIRTITLADGTPLKFSYDGGDKDDGLSVTLNRNYAAEENLTLKIDYHTNWVNLPDPNNLWGSNGKGLRFSQPTSNDPMKPQEIWSMGEPQSNRYWFPGYDAPTDFRTTELTATVNKKLSVISNGNLTNIRENSDGTRTFHWKAEIPYANHLTSIVVGEFIDVKQNYENVQLHNYGYLHEAAWVAASTERLPDMMKFYSGKLGVKYPYPGYSQVFVQDAPGWVGNLTTSTITENMVDDAPTHADFLYLWDLTEAEALAQQWFGGYVTTRDWSHVWLNKAFPRYLSGLYDEYKNGRAEFLLFQHAFDQNTYLGDWNTGNRQPIVNRNYEDVIAFSADNYPYYRGATVLRMLHKHLGEENWWKAIRHYLKSNAHQSVMTENLCRAIAEVTGESMDWFFDQWVYKIGHPIFEVTKSYDTAKKQLTLNVKQTQKIDPKESFPQVEYFQGKLGIEIDDRIETVWLQAKAENVFTFACAQAPKLVHFDYESVWSKEIKFTKTPDELLYQLQHDRDVLGKSWAMNELAQLAKAEKASPEFKVQVQASLRNVITSDAYWRLRLGALSQLQGMLDPAWEPKPHALDEATIATLLTVIKNDKAWLRANAIGFLGMTRDAKYADLYLKALDDVSFRVINSAAVALGKSQSPKAFDALVKLADKPSMKSQGLISALLGLKELGDPRGADLALRALSDLKLPRWRLPTPPVWDFRVVAAETIKALGKSEKAYPMIEARFKKAIEENDLNDIFNNALLAAALADPRGQEVFDALKAKFKDDGNAMKAVVQFETQFKNALKK